MSLCDYGSIAPVHISASHGNFEVLQVGGKFNLL